MSGTQTIQGSIRKSGNTVTPCVALMQPHFGGNPATSTDYTDGFTIAEPLVASPTGTEAWEVTGFSVQVRFIATIATVAAVRYWARWGDMWAGVLKDITPQGPATPTVPVWPPARFPSDLSTFAKIWSGKDDSLTVCNSNTNRIDAHTLVSNQTVLPFPLTVTPGSQLAFAVIMGRSVISATLGIWVSEITYAINYNTKRR